MRDLVQVAIAGIATGCIYALVAYSINLIYSTGGVMNFAQGSMVMVGAMLSVTMIGTWHWPAAIAVPVIVIVGALVGWLIELLAVRPLKRFKNQTMGWLLSTFGASIILDNGAALIWGRSPQAVPGLLGSAPIHVAGLAVLPQQIVIVVGAILLGVTLELFFRRTIVGKATEAVAFNPDFASLMGINVTLVVSLSFAIGGALAGVSGWLLAPLTFASPDMGLSVVILGFITAVIGGIGDPRGALLAGLIVGLLSALVGLYTSSWLGEVLNYAVLIFVLLVRPVGLFGRAAVQRV
jgi:branched-chain amino acid transport system permease protein